MDFFRKVYSVYTEAKPLLQCLKVVMFIIVSGIVALLVLLYVLSIQNSNVKPIEPPKTDPSPFYNKLVSNLPFQFSWDFTDAIKRSNLEKELYIASWFFNSTSSTVTIQLNVSTTGWIGFGFSPDGRMLNSDIVMGYVNSNTQQVILEDRHATASALPLLDTNNLHLLGAMETSTGRTILQFERKLQTEDSSDMVIQPDEPIHIIVSYRQGDPSTENSYLMHTRQGSSRIIFYPKTTGNINPNDYIPPPTDLETSTLELRYPNYALPAVKTSYLCKAFNISQLITEKGLNASRPYHGIRYDPIIQHRHVVHHQILYGCSSEQGVDMENVFDCSRMVSQCTTVTWGWAVGGKQFILPQETGFALGGAAHSIFVLQIHYENHELDATLVDASGVKIYFTPFLRTHEAGVTMLGKSLRQINIPPGQSNYAVNDVCGKTCSQAMVPAQGVTVFAYLLHAHQLGRKIQTTLLKNDSTVDEYFMRNDQYDFNMQEIKYLQRPYQLLPGDALNTTCIYDSTSKTTVTKGGEATEDEMCFTFMFYYPIQHGISYCGSGFCVGSKGNVIRV